MSCPECKCSSCSLARARREDDETAAMLLALVQRLHAIKYPQGLPSLAGL